MLFYSSRNGGAIMNIDLEIELLLDDINEYVNSTLYYIIHNPIDFDIDELIMYLSSIDEKILTIKNLLLERDL